MAREMDPGGPFLSLAQPLRMTAERRTCPVPIREHLPDAAHQRQERGPPMHSLPKSLRQTTLLLGAIALIALASSCRRVTHTPGSVPGPALFQEIEPNDSPLFPDFVAVLDNNSFLAVQGSVEAVGFDIVDHIEFVTDRPLEIDFYLEALSSFGDVDVSIYDPIDDVIVGTYAFSGPSEFGTIVIHEAGRPFQFVIEAFDTDTLWDLELITYPLSGFLREGLEPEVSGGISGSAQDETPLEIRSVPASVATPGVESAGMDAQGSQGETQNSVRPWIEIRARS